MLLKLVVAEPECSSERSETEGVTAAFGRAIIATPATDVWTAVISRQTCAAHADVASANKDAPKITSVLLIPVIATVPAGGIKRVIRLKIKHLTSSAIISLPPVIQPMFFLGIIDIVNAVPGAVVVAVASSSVAPDTISAVIDVILMTSVVAVLIAGGQIIRCGSCFVASAATASVFVSRAGYEDRHG